MSNELEDFISNNREAFDTRMPDPAVLDRIQAQLAGKQKKQAILIPIRTIRWAAAACVIVLAGLGTFWLLNKPAVETTTLARQEQPAKDTPAVPEPETNIVAETINPVIAIPVTRNPKRSNESIAFDEKKQVLFAGLNDMSSSSQRLNAAVKAYQFKDTDKDIVNALVKTMNTDPNTNVRLAALDALSRFYREPYVKQQLVASLTKQKDPMVQIELIQLLTKMKQTSILKELEKITNDENTLKAVKDQAYSGIYTLGS
jgi:cell division protein FtsN